MEKSTLFLAGGCYWCLEAIFQRIKGVDEVISGMAFPDTQEPKVETIKIVYDPEIIELETLLEVFLTSHDPTTINRQGNDVGPEYRSVIFCNDRHEFQIAEKVVYEMQKYYNDPIVTQLRKLKKFKPAPTSHQNYYNKNKENAYCTNIISPKIKKFKEKFSSLYKVV